MLLGYLAYRLKYQTAANLDFYLATGDRHVGNNHSCISYSLGCGFGLILYDGRLYSPADSVSHYCFSSQIDSRQKAVR